MVVHLGIALAQVLNRVVLVDGDLDAPSLHEFFGLDNARGFSSVGRGETPIFEALQEVGFQPNLALLASGPRPAGPPERLAPDRVAEILAAVGAHADVAVIDSPPLRADGEAAAMAGLVDGVILVVGAGRTSRSQVKAALRTLRESQASVLAVVLNDINDVTDVTDITGAHAPTTEPPAPATATAASRASGLQRATFDDLVDRARGPLDTEAHQPQ